MKVTYSRYRSTPPANHTCSNWERIESTLGACSGASCSPSSNWERIESPEAGPVARRVPVPRHRPGSNWERIESREIVEFIELAVVVVYPAATGKELKARGSRGPPPAPRAGSNWERIERHSRAAWRSWASKRAATGKELKVHAAREVADERVLDRSNWERIERRRTMHRFGRRASLEPWDPSSNWERIERLVAPELYLLALDLPEQQLGKN